LAFYERSSEERVTLGARSALEVGVIASRERERERERGGEREREREKRGINEIDRSVTSPRFTCLPTVRVEQI
jgi:hypothetical protein